jgi:hypothetical protein
VGGRQDKRTVGTHIRRVTENTTAQVGNNAIAITTNSERPSSRMRYPIAPVVAKLTAYITQE